MFTHLDCQSNSSTNCRINSWTDCSSNCQIHIQTVQIRYYVSWKTTGYYRKDSLKLAARCAVSGCWPSCYLITMVISLVALFVPFQSLLPVPICLYSANIITTHRASTSMYSLTFHVRVTTPPQYG